MKSSNAKGNLLVPRVQDRADSAGDAGWVAKVSLAGDEGIKESYSLVPPVQPLPPHWPIGVQTRECHVSLGMQLLTDPIRRPGHWRS